MMSNRMRPGDAERMYDFMTLWGLNPVPWQFTLLQALEQQAVDDTFREIIRAAEGK